MRLLFVAAILYVVFLPLWWFVLPAIATAAGTAAAWIYSFFDPRVSITPNGRNITVSVVLPAELAGQPAPSGLRLDTVTYGLPMIAALVMITRADSVLAKVRALLLGLAAMSVLTVPVVMVWAKLTTLKIDEQLSASGNRSSFVYYAFHGYAFSQPVVAVALWLAMLMLGLFRQKKRGDAPVVAASRNAPCPCGSGRKYKRCCGLPPSARP